jgi:hypothetical protein
MIDKKKLPSTFIGATGYIAPRYKKYFEDEARSTLKL